MIICHSTDFTYCRTCYKNITCIKCTVLNKKCCNRAAAFIKLCFNYYTFCLPVRICLKLCHFSNKKNCFKKLINTHFGFSRNRNTDNIAAPFFRNKLMFCKLLHNFIRVCALFIHLVNSNNNFNTCCFSVVYSFNCLRHNTVICCYNQNSNISCHCTPCTHSCESGMARCIKESNLLPVNINLICTDCLSNTAGLG